MDGRRYINRDREGSHDRLWNDYSTDDCKYPSEYFRRRFRMRRDLFMRILSNVEARDVYKRGQLQFVYYRMATQQIVVMNIYKLERRRLLRV